MTDLVTATGLLDRCSGWINDAAHIDEQAALDRQRGYHRQVAFPVGLTILTDMIDFVSADSGSTSKEFAAVANAWLDTDITELLNVAARDLVRMLELGATATLRIWTIVQICVL